MKFRRSSARSTGRWPSPGGRSSKQPRPRGDATTSGARRRPGLTARRIPWRLTPPRAAALLVLLASIGGLNGLASTPAFTLARTELPTLRWTTNEALVDAVATSDGTNLFRIETGPIEDRLRRLPGVAEAHVSVSLPDTLIVTINERTAIMTWRVGDNPFLVDRAGVIFATAASDVSTSGALPTVADTRPESAALGVGSVLDAVDFDAATRLASLTPGDIGSGADSLVITVTEATGFVVGTVPRSWVAVFGLYTPSIRTPAMIPGQVRLLRSLLADREGSIAKVILADEKTGTFVLKASPAP